MAGPSTAERGARGTTPSGPPPRLRRVRRRLRPPGRRTLLVTAVGVTLLGAGAVWLLYGSSWLRAERVRVAGTTVLTADEVRDAADVSLNTPLVAVDTGAIEHRVRERLKRIAKVDVSRSWPHTISLVVTERRPEAIVEEDGKFHEVDATGVRFSTLSKRPKGVPLLEMEPDRSPSSRHFGPTGLRREAVRVATQLPEKVRQDTRSLRVRSYDSITLELTGGRTIAWGSGERGEAKAKALTALMKARPDADHFDVQAPSAPAVSRS
ncbi:cell division protein FtsQ/DivIB [Streptomyces iranensis]|uniref:Cell division protein FtsQ n=1 Tax=Streptomyces iranensis TaxID=576784 RepID=A0A060ZXA9_9ACTN|nr:FtsQ-type POTRA domain-containing protein [Streptomyces iranensis]MBP2059279.1 cell division protein FtsQ [Streptomyces iranensis]CDR11358.1 Polypeptide-transport-associated domain proteinFtsQ-type [Streptomyces iranensis]